MPKRAPRPDVVQDREIVCLLRAGDSRGLTHLIEIYSGRIQSTLRQEFGAALPSLDLDAVMNLAAWRAWRKVGSFVEGRGELGAWFYVIARNTAISAVRKKLRKPHEHVDLATLQPEQVLPVGHGGDSVRASTGGYFDDADEADGAERGDGATRCSSDPYLVGLEECVKALPKLQRKIIRADLRNGDPVKAAELAEELGTSRNSIYVTRSNALKSLRDGMRARGFFVKNGAAVDTELPAVGDESARRGGRNGGVGGDADGGQREETVR